MLDPASGLSVPTQQLDLNNAPVIRQRQSAVDVGLTPVQFEMYQKGALNLPAEHIAPAASLVPPPPASPMEARETYIPPPSQQPLGQAAISQTNQGPPPVLPTDTSRVQDRINQLYGRSKTAEERAADLESKLLDLQRRLDEGYRAPAPAPAQYAPQPPGYQPYGFEAAPSYAPQTLPVGDHVTKAELFQFMKAMQQDTAAQTALANAHTVARLEAEREFPDVYQNPELRAVASEIYTRDQGLQRDPLGVKKAALMARGLSVSDIRVQAATAASQSVRKEALTGLGSTVPAGSGQAPDQSQRLNQALAYARTTGRMEHFVQADLIRRGLG